MTREGNIVIKAIINGRLDHDIRDIEQALSFRETVLNRQKAISIKRNDVVVLNAMGPKYLEGVRCRVVRKLKKNYTLQILTPGVTYRGSTVLRLPPSTFELEERV